MDVQPSNIRNKVCLQLPYPPRDAAIGRDSKLVTRRSVLFSLINLFPSQLSFSRNVRLSKGDVYLSVMNKFKIHN